jgi:CO/xanthine dehydrogenase FAD-binding subunit
MDQNTVTRVIPARTRADLAALALPSALPLAGGSWIYSEENIGIDTLVDLLPLGWPAVEITPTGLTIGATCTLAELSLLANPAEADGGPWAAHPLFFECCTALYGSFKVWNVATVGGNLATALPAGPMTSLLAGLDAEVLVWEADGSDTRMPVTEFITGNKRTALTPGAVLRSISVPLASLHAATAFRKIALSALGRSGAVLVGRLDTDGTFVLTVTAGTVRPVQLRYAAAPDADALAADIAAIDAWFTDAHGAADWRRAVSGVLGEEIRAELAQSSESTGEDAR